MKKELTSKILNEPYRSMFERSIDHLNDATKLNVCLHRVAELERSNRKFKEHIRVLTIAAGLKSSDVYGMPDIKKQKYTDMPAIQFYRSKAWLELRYKFIRDNKRECKLCQATTGEMHVDHIKPRSIYPEIALEIKNLQMLCRRCNLGKGARV